MCWRGSAVNSTPQVLPPPPPPPAPPAAPLPQAEPLVTDVNPQVKRAKSKKDKNPMTKGTGALRIRLDPQVNTGTTTPSGGLNIGP